ncbi:nucleotidyltransferase-like protein [Bacillus tuaregi]|uniref:nucleotidyltransferase-like protein n=1 Tax=Bacillus tuaregi TaxID=1816695 RepID=UPI0008F807C0|nr:nucleotidyltransferase-like protein [Bacillus tuaregi]
MEDILRPIYQERASQVNTLGVLIVEKREKSVPFTDTFDAILLIVVKDSEHPVYIKHYSYQNKKAAMHIVTEAQLNEWLLVGSNRKVVEWIYLGRVLFDRNEFLHNLRAELDEFPFKGRKLKMGLEFAKLIRRYMDGKAFFNNNQYLDAFNHIVHSLHHLGRLALIENGFHPEVSVWKQVKQIEPEIYQLYYELVNSDEDLEKRLKLLFLASDFLIHSRTEMGIDHLIDILKMKESWSFNEIASHPELNLYSVDLEVLFEYLVEKHFIEVVTVETKGIGILHRNYKAAEKFMSKKQ